jgi:hypothetical protein
VILSLCLLTVCGVTLASKNTSLCMLTFKKTHYYDVVKDQNGNDVAQMNPPTPQPITEDYFALGTKKKNPGAIDKVIYNAGIFGEVNCGFLNGVWSYLTGGRKECLAEQYICIPVDNYFVCPVVTDSKGCAAINKKIKKHLAKQKEAVNNCINNSTCGLKDYSHFGIDHNDDSFYQKHQVIELDVESLT